MTEREIRPDQFLGAVDSDLDGLHEAVLDAAYDVALWGEVKATARTDELGLVDAGVFKNSWDSARRSDGAEVTNNAPYAPVIEHGRRPGRPGPPLAPILEWVNRKLVANGEVKPEEAKSVAWAIRNSIHAKGQEPHHILLNLKPDLEARFQQEVTRLIRSMR